MALPTAPLVGQPAIDYTWTRIGDTMPDGSGYCLKFVRQDFEIPNLYASAIDAWNASQDQHPDDRNPPPGVPMFFWSSSIYRHVAFHLGGGTYATTFNADIRALSLASMESSFGPVIGWAGDLNAYLVWSGSDPIPGPDPEPPLELEDDMIRIFAPGRGFAIIGPGHYHPLTEEEYQQSEALVTKTLEGNDRQFDVWRQIASYGVAPGA